MGKRKPTRRTTRPGKAKTKANAKAKVVPSVTHRAPRRDTSATGDLGRRLAEALEQQAATSEILRIIRRSPTDVQPVFEMIAERAMHLCGALHAGVCTFDGTLVHLSAFVAATPGFLEALRRTYPMPPGRSTTAARAVLTGTTVHIPDIEKDPEYTFSAAARAAGFRSALAVPMLRDGQAIGSIVVFRGEAAPFSDRLIQLLETFADQAVIAIDNARLFQEREARHREVTEALEQQTATSEILSVISSSPTETQPVFDAIAAAATDLCAGANSGVFLFDGTLIHFVAHHGWTPEDLRAVRETFPRPPGRGSIAARAVLTRAVAHSPDIAADPEYEATSLQMRFRSVVSVPMLRDGEPIGAINVTRREPVAFTPRQIALLETFARQAVIAIQNVRLFTELEERNRDLTDALDRQTATAEILRAISRAQADVRPVFEAIADSARRLFGAFSASVFRYDGGLISLVAARGGRPGSGEAFMEELQTPRRPTEDSPRDRAVLTRTVQHVVDVLADPLCGPRFREQARLRGFRSSLAVPMLRGETAVGAIAVTRDRVGGFAPTEIALLQTFADQAVIAVENARLLAELQARNSDLTETLEQQTATGEVLRIISTSPTDLRPVLETVAENAARLCGADDGHIWQRVGTELHLVVSRGGRPVARPRLTIGRQSVVGRAAHDGVPVHVEDLAQGVGTEFPDSRAMHELGYRTILAVPLLREGTAIGVIMIRRTEVRPFTATQIALVKTFADQAVIAIENVRLFEELRARNDDLSEALEQQTATGEILRVISRSPTDMQPVFDAIVESAVRLCGARFGVAHRFDGERLHLVSLHNLPPATMAALQGLYPMRPDRSQASGRAVLSRSVVVIEDLLDDPDYRHDLARADQWRSMLAVPMLRAGEPLGTIVIWRMESGPFSAKQIELMKTFADQAVIAIENVRLFKELESRNRELTETLEQQTATGEILRVISSSPTDVQPVFDTIVRNARGLCGADSGAVFRYDGALIHLEALDNAHPERVDVLRREYPMPATRGHATGRAILTGRPVNVPDVREDPEYSLDALRDTVGLRSLLSVPLVRDGLPIGAITLHTWMTPRPFSSKQIALLETFADQAVIAVQNVRLFQELEARNRELTETLEQQTATSEILRVISSSPTNVQPVLDAVAENAARLCSAEDVSILEDNGGLFRVVAFRGADQLRGFEGTPVTRGSVAGRAMLDGRLVHVHDIAEESEAEFPVSKGFGRQVGHRTMLATPLLREGTSIGAIFVRRTEVRPFSDKQIELLKTFADQAVIAIENVRLFQELEARTRDLSRSVEELKALGEVSQAVGSTLDLDTVLATIVSRAVQLSACDQGVVYEFDGATQTFHQRATYGVSAERVETARAAPIRLGEGAMGRAGVTRQPVQVEDIQADPQLVAPQVRGLLIREGMRALLAVPLLRDERLLGGLVILRREQGVFSPDVIAMLQTFATQSGLAIHNAGLFREIQRQKQYSEALVETSPVAIVTMDLDGKVAGWNPGAERLFGYAPEEALGYRMEDLVATPEIREDVQSNIRQTLEGQWIRAIARRARKDGTMVDVEISSMPVVVDGARMGMIGIYHDITGLLQARREAEAANEAKSAFLATMSHEIRTPMNAVIGMSGLLLNTALTDEQREYAEVVRQSGDALLTVINDILDFSKIEAGKLELESQPFDVRECIEGALDLVATRAAEKGLDLAYMIGDGTPAAVAGDVTRLRQVLLNLLSNAVKFTERGEVVLSVSARPLDEAPGLHEVAFSVRDTGIGIPADRLGRLFQSFSQVDASTTRRYGGTGLGLAISQRLTELMGGWIDVTSQVGVGSEFRFTIRAPAAEAPVPAPRRDLSGVQPALRGKRVLVVDDNATNRRILVAHLEAWGLLARATESPREALGWIAADERFDVGILDMHMPEMDGVALARALRGHPAGAALTLVLFTSLGRREARADEEGFAAYLHKPIKPSQLFDTLISVLADHPILVSQREVRRTDLDPEMARRHPLRILLAEDNVVNQKVALRLLGQMGYRADMAANGLEAIEAVERQTYDVVLMDVQMPEMDGFEASREITRRWARARRPRIVAMTANAMQGDRELCEAAGMDDYVAKPIRVEELVAALERSSRRPEAGEGTAAAGDGRAPSRAGGIERESPVGPSAGADGGAVPAVDRAVIDRLAETMGGAFVAELIATFVEDGRALVATLRRGAAGADLDGFRRAAHSLKSNAETLGAGRLADLARELEQMARAGALEGAAERIEPLGREYESAVSALEQSCRGLAS